MNWSPLLLAVEELWQVDQVLSGYQYSYDTAVCLITDLRSSINPKSYLHRTIKACRSMTRTQRQGILALHKFLYYAEINAKAGIEKFLARI